ncbi:GtrA family protein [Achromobacter kerstersii]|uniref:GtrA family protein n=1 Tax=Achromobacter kerstersii TaxID=1353890 RepID=UPI003D021E94
MRNPEGQASRSSYRFQLLRYAIVGVVSNALGYMVYLLLTQAGIAPKMTVTLLYITTAALAFFGNRRLTFQSRSRFLGPALRYVIAHGIGYVINLALLAVFADRLGVPHQWVQLAAIFVVAGFMFFALRWFVFADRSEGKLG